MRWCFLFLLVLAGEMANVLVSQGEGFDIAFSEQQLSAIEKKYGPEARKRVNALEQLVADGRLKSEDERLTMANSFFNLLAFVSDQQHWGVNDYWATPIEMLGTGGGDCEDYSISKYFTLLAMGVPSDKLKITYVKASGYGLRNAAHMVLAYYATPNAVPLVLDNLVGEVLPASQRNDLTPVYSFNGEGLWLARSRGATGKRVDGGNRISLWRDMIARMGKEY